MKRMFLVCVFVFIAHAAGAQTGTWELWQNPATMPASPQDLANNPWVLGNPTVTQSVANFDAPQNIAGSLVGRIRARLLIPQTGNYLFWDASNGASMTWCGTDQNFAGKSPIAKMTNAVPVSHNQWTRYAEQKSVPVALTAGQAYYCTQVYIDTVVESPVNLNHASLKWQLPDLTQAAPIPGASLQPAPALPPSFSLTNNGVTTSGSGTATSTISANLVAGVTQPVAFSIQSGLPTGMTSSFVNAACNPTCASVLTLTTGPSTPAGTYTIVVAGTVQWVVQTTSLQLTVALLAKPTPTITASPIVIRLGESSTVTANTGPNSTTCMLSAAPANSGWSGPVSVLGVTAKSIMPATTTVFSITCTNAAGTTPASVAVAVNPITVTLAWDAVTENLDKTPATVLGYNVYWRTGSDTYVKGGTTTGAAATQATVSGFTADVTYYFAVTAFDATNESAFSVELPRIM